MVLALALCCVKTKDRISTRKLTSSGSVCPIKTLVLDFPGLSIYACAFDDHVCFHLAQTTYVCACACVASEKQPLL